MPHLDNQILERILYIAGAALVLYLGYRIGKALGMMASSKLISQKEQELFTAQRGFKTLYENELATIKVENDSLKAQVEQMTAKVEEYRKKAAGLGGLFSSGGKKADAMYALLLENEALEEALYNQNEKLKQERTDALKEQMRNTGYRRVLMSQLLSDERIKGYVAEVLSDEKRLPSLAEAKALPAEEHS
jgi:predicted RNase H-like nuclease (RuvC/YqgF family)